MNIRKIDLADLNVKIAIAFTLVAIAYLLVIMIISK